MRFEPADVVRLEIRGQKACVTLNRPEARNALNTEVLEGLRAAFMRIEEDADVRVAVLCSTGGKAFSAGADLKEFAQRQARGELVPLDQLDPISPLADLCTKPLIAAIDGHALGGGLELALLCDIRVATTGSEFALPEPRRGLMAGYGLHHLSRTIPLGEALLMQLSGGRMTAARAHQIGLVQGLAADRVALFEQTERIADAIAACAPLAVAAIRRVVREGRALPVADSVELARTLEKAVYASEDFLEGPRAFAEKRPPVWRER